MRKFLLRILGGVPREDFDRFTAAVRSSQYALRPDTLERQRGVVLARLDKLLGEFRIRPFIGPVVFTEEIAASTISAEKLSVDLIVPVARDEDHPEAK